ncbi:MAG: hypothetical protein IT462_02395 [Planctomycetes bacterium]|nr:hypothetical protein [Planctomycetota bacterium]
MSVVVLRTAAPAALPGPVSGLAQALARSRAEVVALAAGPYRYPYAAALELSRMLNGGNLPGPVMGAESLSRSRLAQALLPHLKRLVVLRIARLEWVDTESLTLLAALIETSRAIASAGHKGRWWAVCGLGAGTPTDRMGSLLDPALALCSDVEPPAQLPASVSPQERRLMAVLHAAPHPLPLPTAFACAGLSEETAGVALRRLAGAQLIDSGPRLGLGCAADTVALQADELNRARAALTEFSEADVPESRLALAGEQAGSVLRALSWQLGQRALEEGEPNLALARMRQSGKLSGRGCDEIIYARALARVGALDSALGILDQSRHEPADARMQLEQARLAFDLAMAGRVGARDAEKILRRVERLGRSGRGIDCCIEVRAMRAEIMLRRKDVPRALALLRRRPPGSLQTASPAARHRFLVAKARTLLASGRATAAHQCLDELRAIPRSDAEMLAVEHLALASLPGRDEALAAHKRALVLAARVLDARAVSAHARALGAEAVAVLASVLGRADGAAMADGGDPRLNAATAWHWFSARGATLLATLEGEHASIFPPEARANPGLCAWLKVVLSRVGRHAGAQLIQLSPIPNAGNFGGDLLLVSPGFGRVGPTVVALKREQFSDSTELLRVASDPRALLQRALDGGELEPAALRAWLDDWERARFPDISAQHAR